MSLDTTPPQDPTVPATPADPAARGRLVETAEGASTDAFGAIDWGLFAFAALVWGSSFLFMDIGLDAFAPAVVTTARIGLGAATLVWIRRARTPLPRDDWPRVALLGVVWMAIPLSLFPIAQQHVDSAVAGMVNGAVPLATAVWATVLLRRLPGRVQLVGLGVGFAGIVAIAAPEFGSSSATAFGVSLVLVAMVLYGLAFNLAVPLQQRHGALPVILRAQLVAFVLTAPLGVAGLAESTFAWAPALAMIPLGALGTGLAYVASTTLVGRVGGARGSLPVYLTPLVAIVMGVAFRSEVVTWAALVGTGLVLLGAWLASRREVLRPAGARRR